MLQETEQALAAKQAIAAGNQINAMVKNVTKALNEGIPERLHPQTQAVISPGVSAEAFEAAFIAAFGADGLARVRGAAAVFNGTAIIAPAE